MLKFTKTELLFDLVLVIEYYSLKIDENMYSVVLSS